MQFKYAKLVKSYEQIERNWPKCNFFGQNGQILVKKGPKPGPKRFLSKLSLGDYSNRPKMQFKYAKLVKSYEQIERN